jgi:hypothetical protein
MLVFGGVWTDPASDQEVIAKLRDWFHALKPFTGGYYRQRLRSSPTVSIATRLCSGVRF